MMGQIRAAVAENRLGAFATDFLARMEEPDDQSR
jgi:hypothetical protein